jgi:hypothetical protein
MLKRQHLAEDPEIKLYRNFCRKMAKAGIRIRSDEGPNAFAMRAKTLKPELSPLIDEITQIFVRLRYHRSPPADGIKQLKKSVGAVPASMKRAKP